MPLRRHVANPIPLVRRREVVRPDEVSLRAAVRSDVEIDVDEDRCVPQIRELRAVEEDAVADDDRGSRRVDAQHVRAERVEVERIEVVAGG